MTPPRANTFASNGTSSRALPMNAPLVVSAISVAIIVVIAFSALATSLAAAFGIGAADGDPGEAVKKLVAVSQEKNQTYQDRFNGRSVFYKPPSWPAPPSPPVTQRDEVVVPPPPPPPAKDGPYTGPGIWYAIGDVVRFRAKTASDKPFDVRVGEEKNGIRVVSTNLPWTVHIEYLGRPHDINIWERKPDGFLLAQAPAIEVIPGLIEVPPPRPIVDVPKATGEPAVEAPTASAAPAENATAQPGARTSRREARGNRAATPQGRPQAQPARQDRPARGASAPDPAPEDPDEAEEAEADEAGDEDEAKRADEEADSEVAGESQPENHNPQNPAENAGDVAPHRNPPAQPPSTGSA